MRYSGHVDRFAEKRLPSGDAMPELRFDLPALHYPEKLNAAAWLLDRRIAAGDGRRRCIVAPGFAWTYGDLFAAANRIAHVLVQEYALRPGNRVLLRAANTPMLAACWLAVLKAGGIAVTTMPLYRSAELRFMIEKAQVKLALCDRRLREELAGACAGIADFETVYFGDGETGGLDARMARMPAEFRQRGNRR